VKPERGVRPGASFRLERGGRQECPPYGTRPGHVTADGVEESCFVQLQGGTFRTLSDENPGKNVDSLVRDRETLKRIWPMVTWRSPASPPTASESATLGGQGVASQAILAHDITTTSERVRHTVRGSRPRRGDGVTTSFGKKCRSALVPTYATPVTCGRMTCAVRLRPDSRTPAGPPREKGS
jgi:hypothetical protein